ncbi:MAG: type II toxin-antitoxin system Phd/YefM family antitoxin [Candidatus Berkelbacteria bacterium]|nr:type II toxin-antitoxin system Phd/YefM family antitoxin [Candidatus Berkelbacteria bacterium]
MDIRNTISSTEARQKFAEVIDNIDRGSARYTLTVNGKPKVVMMNAEEFEGWEETMEIMRDAKLTRELKKVLRTPYNPKDYITLDEFVAQEKSWPKN